MVKNLIQLGDRLATMPLYALWDALDVRNYNLTREMTFGEDGDEGQPSEVFVLVGADFCRTASNSR